MNFTTQKYLTSSCVINILRLTVYSGDMTSHTDRCYKLIALSNQTVLFLSLSPSPTSNLMMTSSVSMIVADQF